MLNKENGIVELRLNNFLFNAGLIGFYKVIEKYPKVELVDNIIRFPVDILNNFTEDYFEALITEYYNTTAHYDIVSRYDSLKKLDWNNEEYNERIQKYIAFAAQKLLRSSYQSGYAIIKNYHDDKTDIVSLAKRVNKKTPLPDIKDIFAEIIAYLVRHKDVLAMKDIAYTRIGQYWSNMAFLLRSNSKKDMKEYFNKAFLVPFKLYLDKNQGTKMTCMDCGAFIKGKSQIANSWLNDKGVDVNRKRSYFWNFKPDSFICPICALVYTCVPLGFVMYGNDGVFINNNESIKLLGKFNEIQQIKETVQGSINKLYVSITEVLNKEYKAMQNELQNIQVIIRKRNSKGDYDYAFSIISKDKLKIMQVRQKQFDSLANNYLRINDRRVYEIVVSNFFNGINQYKLLNNILASSFKNKTSAYGCMDILLINNGVIINNRLKNKGGTFVGSKDIYRMKLAGNIMRGYYKTDSDKVNDIDNKLRSFVYHLLNALKTGDKNAFMDIVLRMYSGQGKAVPDLFIEMLKSADNFKTLGYAYVIGLKGEKMKEKEEDK